MTLILHITTREQWERAKSTGAYRGDTLDSEGFIHCSTPAQVIPVANAFFRGQSGLVLLCIDSAKVQTEIRYEAPEPGGEEAYPHIYGPLNADAVVRVLAFEPGADGTFALPGGIPGLSE
jgi:uncharacterized protein (DUF952 family)